MCRGCRKRGGRRGILKVPTLGDTGADIGARESRKGRKKSGRRKVPKSGRNRNKITQNCVIFCIQKGAKEQEPGLKVGGEREEWTPCPPPPPFSIGPVHLYASLQTYLVHSRWSESFLQNSDWLAVAME